MIQMDYVIYRYVDVRTDTVIYIGKTRRELSLRVAEHASELKFLPYLPYVQISYYRVGSQTAMDVHEKYWIHTLQPVLNCVDRLQAGEVFGMGFMLFEPVWRSYDAFSRVMHVYDASLPVPDTEVSAEAALLDEDTKLFHAESFLEQLFDAYVSDSLDVVSGSMVRMAWDLDAYPLPDFLVCPDGTKLGFFVRSEPCSDGTYFLYLPMSVVRVFVRYGRESIQGMRKDVTVRRLV